MKHRVIMLSVLFACNFTIPLVGAIHYYDMLLEVPSDERILFAYWLTPAWSPVMFASTMYHWGGALGVCIGLYSYKLSLRFAMTRIFNYTLFSVTVGILSWGISTMFLFHTYPEGITITDLITRNAMAWLAVYQYIVFWAFLSYSCAHFIRTRVITFALMITIQITELFWVVQNYPMWEAVLPTAISRLGIALSYPVWRSDSWASQHPTFIGSSPMTLTNEFTPMDLGVPWIALIEGIYILLGSCVFAWHHFKNKEEVINEPHATID